MVKGGASAPVRSWQAAYRGIVPDALLDSLAEDAWLERWTDQLAAAGVEGIHQLVSTDAQDGTPRAVAACGPAMEPTAELTGQISTFSTPTPELLRRVHELLAADGHSGAMLWVAANNDRSIEFYEYHGWTKDGETQREEVAGGNFDEIRMRRELSG